MKAQMYQRAPTMAIASSVMLFPNYPFFMSSFGSDDDNESKEHFDFNINKKLLLNPNDVVVGEMIGEGSKSIVDKGIFKDQPVAVKIVQPSRTSAVSIQQKQQFQNEVMLLSSMKHDNIVKFVGACIEPQLMIVTELLEGGTLQKFMLNSRPSLLDLKMSLSFALDISRAMEFLHSKGIIHRDLNPRNVLVTGDMKKAKLADFGLAREKSIGDMTCEAGTYRWMAPEVCSREPLKIGEKKHYDHKVDVYSFALIFWSLLTNQTPFSHINRISIPYFVNQGERPRLDNIPDEIVPILESCWAEDSKERLEFKEITILLEKLLNNLCSGSSNDTISEEEGSDGECKEIIIFLENKLKCSRSGNDTAISDEEAYEDGLDDLMTTWWSTCLFQKGYFRLKKPKEKKEKNVMNMILPFFKTFFSSN